MYVQTVYLSVFINASATCLVSYVMNVLLVNLIKNFIITQVKLSKDLKPLMSKQ